MTYKEICSILREAGIENAETEASLLINFFCHKSRAEILAFPQAEYNDKSLFEAIDKRCERYPLQYIFGEWYFYGETYTVDENCLIPRPDTELLVEYAIKNLPKGAKFADLCTGSGCIAVSILVHRPDTNATGLDLFPETVKLALHNAKSNGVSECFDAVCADLLTEVPFGEAEFDAIISNPPYIRTAVVSTLEEELFAEPKAALDGGEDGLKFYRRILSSYLPCLKEDGFILLEIGFDQSEDIATLSELYGLECEIRADLGGNPRMAILKRKYGSYRG